MPKIDKPSAIDFSYSAEEIVELIIRDLIEQHGIVAAPKDVQVNISGGRMYDANADYSGGIGSDWQCDPVKFNGFRGFGTTKL